MSGPEVIKLFSCSSAEHEIFSANKYENANSQLCLARKKLQLLVI